MSFYLYLTADQKYIILFNCHFDFAMKRKDTDCNIRFAQTVGTLDNGAVPFKCMEMWVLSWSLWTFFPEKRWKGTEEPVVILLGWAGCRDKHLTKYSSMYNDQVGARHSTASRGLATIASLLLAFYSHRVASHSGTQPLCAPYLSPSLLATGS